MARGVWAPKEAYVVNDARCRGRHGLTAIAVAAGLALLSAAPALAKVPYFSVEISPPEPMAGEPILVTVRTWEDVAHTVPMPFEAPDLDGLLAIRPVASPWAPTDVPLHPSGPGEFEGSIVVPIGGNWMLVAFPDRAGWSSPVPPGYPDTIFFSVRGETDAISPIAAGAGIAAILATLAVLLLRLRRTRPRHSRMPAAGAS